MIIFLCCSTAHYVLAAVMALLARHQVKYLAMAWIMTIFASAMLATAFFSDAVASRLPGMLHPYALMIVMGVSYLQSIYPLSIPMPGFLQWGRMCRYALPAIVLILLYAAILLAGHRPTILHGVADFRRHALSLDVLLRLAMMVVSFYYVINIFLLPRRMAHVRYPRYLVGYSMVLGLSVIFYQVVSVSYDVRLMMAYVVVFTLLNLYLCFRVLETMALELPRPVIKEVSEAPADEPSQKAEHDFNEMNLQRFLRLESWMQRNTGVWTANTFNRDSLCRETGINRHLLLQSLRSQGYNNVHDYINTYRINELKRRIQRGQISTLTDCLDAGFGTIKTVRACFLKLERQPLDSYMQQYAPRK
ncbi:MAG: hypothetical protein K2H79_07165 [Bacteroidaceae bacterium]|nr:hypothetical protein [Bacteroidaceae bacterium]MDE7165997.1 hypothetical protein [Bacteroidaceae bacterium]